MSQKEQTTSKAYNLSPILKFILPSCLGIFLFMLPLVSNGSITIPIAILSGKLQSLLSGQIFYILYLVIALSALGAICAKLFKAKFILNRPFLNSLFNISWIGLTLRILSFIFMTLIYLSQKGTLGDFALFNMIVSSDTGNLVLQDLLPVLFSIFLFAGLFLPLLLNFGLLEFVGTLLVKVMRPIFNLPGRSAIDCLASWLGDGTIGVLLTSKQYEEGFYTQKEAAIIGTSFSLVSITFSLVVINTVGLGNYFVPFYLTVTFASLIAAIIIPKLPPLRGKSDCLYDGSMPLEEEVGNSKHLFSKGIHSALERAKSQNIIQCVIVDGFKNVLDMWIGVLPIVMAVGTIALIIATYTPIFEILGLPFTPLLSLLGVPEAAAASQTLIAGFADMLLPSILATSIESDMTRFIVASVSVTQLIYLSEVGALLLGSKIPVNLWELFVIFIERTLLTLPIVAIIAHFIF